jgi:hypothetical protein
MQLINSIKNNIWFNMIKFMQFQWQVKINDREEQKLKICVPHKTNKQWI